MESSSRCNRHRFEIGLESSCWIQAGKGLFARLHSTFEAGIVKSGPCFQYCRARSRYCPLRVRGLMHDSVNPKLERRTIMTQNIKNVVLVHGAFADGSGWEAVANILKNDGYKVSVPQPPETSYADDQKYTKAAIDAMDGPVVLVGHSYGGSIITEGGNHPKVAALVYIAAFALDEGESCASIEQAVPQASKAFKSDSNGLWWIDQTHFVADFASDIPRDEAEFMAISQVPISTDSFTHKVTNPAWKHKPTWYMVATADRSINPDQERMMAKRAKAKTVEVKASHVAYMSFPKETAKLIEEAAASVDQ